MPKPIIGVVSDNIANVTWPYGMCRNSPQELVSKGEAQDSIMRGIGEAVLTYILYVIHICHAKTIPEVGNKIPVLVSDTHRNGQGKRLEVVIEVGISMNGRSIIGERNVGIYLFAEKELGLDTRFQGKSFPNICIGKQRYGDAMKIDIDVVVDSQHHTIGAVYFEPFRLVFSPLPGIKGSKGDTENRSYLVLHL